MTLIEGATGFDEAKAQRWQIKLSNTLTLSLDPEVAMGPLEDILKMIPGLA